MTAILGFYSSEYSEPRNHYISLGGPPHVLLNGSDSYGNVFNDVEEYESVNGFQDFRVLYLRNMALNNVTIGSVTLAVKYNFTPHMDKATKFYLSGVKMNVMVPPYIEKNEAHPLITADGTFRDTGINMRDIIATDTTSFNYGKSIIMKEGLASGDYIAIVLHRVVTGPSTYLKGYTLTLDAAYAVK